MKKGDGSLTRRKFLSRAGGAGTALVAAGAGLPSLLGETGAGAKGTAATRLSSHEVHANVSTGSNPVAGPERRLACFRNRLFMAFDQMRKPPQTQTNNGDESLYASDYYAGNYSKALPHDGNGLVTPSAYQTMLAAVQSGRPSDFLKIPLGGTVPLVSPQAGLTFPLIGADYANMPMPPAPTLASAQRAAEMVENYWLALLRDVGFSDYTNPDSPNAPLVNAAIADLNKLSDYQGQTPVTGANLFRGTTAADLVGPHVSQFLLQPISGLGALAIDNSADKPAQLYNLYAPAVDYMTDSASWLAVENGQASVPAQARTVFQAFGLNEFAGPGYLWNGRSLSALVHVDELYQHYFFAASELLSDGFPANPGNPYSATLTPNQIGFATWGGPADTGLLGTVAMLAIQNVWYQKWFVQRALRPEEYAGRVQNVVVNKLDFPLHPQVLNSAAAAQVFSTYGAYYLPMAFPEGCPTHPSYGSGHMTVAAACCTVLKALFDDSTTFLEAGITPVYSPDGVNLLPYTGSDVDQITVGTELNKLASNIGIGRNTAGVHWHSDYEQSMYLGESTAINMLQDMVNSYNESGYFQFTSFSGQQVTIAKS